MPFKEKDVFNFSSSIIVTVTSQSNVPFFLIKQSVYLMFSLSSLKMITFGAILSQNGCKLLEEDQNEILIQCRPKCNVKLTLV